MQAKKILLVVNGAKKAEILEKVLYGPVTPAVPASILQLHPNVTVVADQEALAKVHERHSLAD
jgi:glucosamine-6-phosphate deaminase